MFENKYFGVSKIIRLNCIYSIKVYDQFCHCFIAGSAWELEKTLEVVMPPNDNMKFDSDSDDVVVEKR